MPKDGSSVINAPPDAGASPENKAEYWHSQCQSMVEQLRDDAREVGLTQDGTLVVMPTEAAQVAA